MSDYMEFINTKLQSAPDDGFEPFHIPEKMLPVQKYLVNWAIRKGRSATYADCGFGKTYIQLVWAQNAVQQTNKPVLIATPLAVSRQTVEEGEKFDIDVVQSRDGKFPKTAEIVVTNYEKLHLFNPSDFGGFAGDESSILKNFKGKTKEIISEFVRTIPYRWFGTATAAPNDYHELGTTSEALGYLGYQDMLSQFFKKDSEKDFRGWGRAKYRFRGHAQEPFWRWVCSWSRACRKPSDLGFEDDGFNLPPLNEKELIIEARHKPPGHLFSLPAGDLKEQRAERKRTINERCESVVDLVAGHDSSVVWCHTNDEGDLLEKIIPNGVQVAGKHSDEVKEERLMAFQHGEIETLIIKPKIGAFGLNWQHCNNVITFPSNSFEQYYQSVRRCYRYGQKRPVDVTIVTTEGELRVLKNLQRKMAQATEMFDSIVRHMGNAMHIEGGDFFATESEIPSWL